MSIQDYLPKKSVHLTTETTVVQARVPLFVVEEVREQMEKENLSWADVMTASLFQFLDERGVKFKERRAAK
jgi:hypothetical protein